MEKQTTELATIEHVGQLTIFPVGQVNSIIEMITKEALSLVPDTTTAKGRKEIASTAYKVAQSKTYLDKLGVKCKEEAQKKVKAVDEERRTVRESLDKLKEEVRNPLTLWEVAEEERIAAEKAEVEYNAAFDEALIEHDLFLRRKAIEEKEAQIAKEEAERAAKEEARIAAEKAEAERVQAEKERVEREEKLKREAAEKATREAEERAMKEKEEREKAEKERVEREEIARKKIEDEKLAAIKAKEDAERLAAKNAEDARLASIAAEERAKAAAEKALNDAEDKRLRDIQEERERAEKIRKAEQKEREEKERLERERVEAARIAEEKRQADVNHRKIVNNETLKSLVSIGLDQKTAKLVVTAIAKGEVQNVSIKY